MKWIVAHSTNALLSALGFYMVWTNATFATKPWQCRQSDVNECVDQRAATFLDLWDTLMWAMIYWLARVILFWMSHRRRDPLRSAQHVTNVTLEPIYGDPSSRLLPGRCFPMFIHGTPWRQQRKEGRKGDSRAAAHARRRTRRLSAVQGQHARADLVGRGPRRPRSLLNLHEFSSSRVFQRGFCT